MGYIDNLTNKYFRLDNLDRTVFVPWGTRGSAYVLPDENYENDIKRVLNRFYLVLAMLYILIIATFGPLFLLLLLPIYFPLKMLITKHKTRGLQSINSSFTISKY
jgi:hypothetical protein